MTDAYRTVAGRASAQFEVRGSEFIGYVSPADGVDAAEAFVAEIEEKHPDATHNVPAYRVPAGPASASNPGDVMLREYQSDDGEPTGSSGKPALNVLVQQDIRNVVAVVTRYYGGTNLGVGGLARSYSRAVKEAVEAAGVVEELPHETFSAEVEYDDSGTVRGILESAGVEFDADYEESVRFEVRVPVDDADALRERLRNATSGRVELGG
ncbi:IMPACT family protein [Haloprofundus halophilus]|uniref:IMPACT family protein n=1 Tax=Haloprofundus halophilus TaxID=2283527 RepID=UPI000E4315F7|nr:YigZ family protein [Haloprofundus halophilus]